MATKHVRILGRKYKVTAEKDDNRSGFCDNAAGQLNVTPGQDAFLSKDTLLHEIMHAILFQQGSSHAYKLEESFVRPLATGLMTVMQDNPKLAAELFSKIK